ncbi:MBL fold metallo-hydrolase [Micromonospora sp. KC721]|uniref:MBL fold metallo-hydrolase n=1 Tax=Micromonospora sp. KC721 TaxID=2530380 RepID=UPI001FB6797C|nr:MBL fold metallo-hydrolase [Micromonospora sp. KC721]
MTSQLMAFPDDRDTAPYLDEIAEGVYAFLQPDGGWCLNNAGVVVNGDDVVVVDTAATERRAELFRALIAEVTDVAPTVVVNTHFHGDHTFGNFVFSPPAAVVAHEAARREMLVAGLGLQGLWPHVRWGEVTLRPPTVTYRDRMDVYAGELRLQLIHPGPAHTVTDTVVWIPDRSVVFAGDIVMSGVTPFCLMGSIEGSLRAIERLRALRPSVVVPGHGPVGGPELFDEAEEYLRWIKRLARAGVAAGRSPLETARAADLGPFAAFIDAERILPNLHRAYAEERGAAPGAELDVLACFTEMVEFHGRLPTCHA